MGDKTGIEWTEATWNPIVGCSLVSPGCTNCYAMGVAARLLDGNPKAPHYAGTTQPSKGGPVWTGKVALAPEHILEQPLRWSRPRVIFVNSMGDLFHEDVPGHWINQVFAIMALCPQHTFQILTKRADRMHEWCTWPSRKRDIDGTIWSQLGTPWGSKIKHGGNWQCTYPLPNVWLGVSAEDQRRADERLPILVQTPAAVRFVSAEPLIGPVDLSRWLAVENIKLNGKPHWTERTGEVPQIGWVIGGGESGKGARPMHPDWARSLRDQCAAADVPFFFKQWGEWVTELQSPEDIVLPSSSRRQNGVQVWRAGKKAAGSLLDGREHKDMPVRP